MSATPIALVYGSSTCYTEMTAEKIRDYLGADRVTLINLADSPLADVQPYPYIIMGIPTWDYGELQEDWEERWPELDTVDFTGKPVALFGQGDQVGYPEWFLDAMGYLHDKLVVRGALPTGYWPNQGYEFEASKALTSDGQLFYGLALDDENQFEESEARIQTWCDQLRSEWQL
ncbi:flavodoxin FldB [Simiduia agarivorans]|uniref:Flavodoxin n=1 Tax=Simiduia agarivorans (strain DSM 21679 / JCM 13881 / BCRC 17597 / SA1) TaxID=1117647 RepID=K4KIP3_SIMAS|nr:flavodoxin FldB [Simiduia agarivorans SA1 = DSM 21679]